MRKKGLEHSLGDAPAGRKKVLPEYSFVKYGTARIIKTWAKNKITNVLVLTESILRNERAKHKNIIQVFKPIQLFRVSCETGDTEASTGLTVNLNFVSSST